jgi:serine/threonine protein kinase
LVLEYVPLGTLEDQAKKEQISAEENLEALRQALSALRHLHEREDPIVHRDIKPSNILVQSRNPFHIKLSDFGYSKENEDYLTTFCGTKLYAAPEIYARESYDGSVDIWSLGVVVFQYAHGLPDPGRSERFKGQKWTKEIIKALKTEINASYCPLLDFLLRAMLVNDSESRYSAHRCSEAARQLDVSQFCCSTPTLHPQKDKQTAIYHHEDQGTQPGPSISQNRRVEEDDNGEDQETVIFQDAEMTMSPNTTGPSADEYSSAPTDTGRYARSGAPGPESDASVSTVKKRATRVSKWSSRHTKRRTSTRRQHPLSAEVDYHEKWMDALDPLGGGSSLILELGLDIGSTGTTQSSQPSASPESLDEQESDAEFVFQGWMTDWKSPTESCVRDLGGNFPQGNTVQGMENGGKAPWTDSQQNLATLLQQAIPDTPPQ